MFVRPKFQERQLNEPLVAIGAVRYVTQTPRALIVHIKMSQSSLVPCPCASDAQLRRSGQRENARLAGL